MKENLKENYEKMELEIIEFEGRDIITISGGELPQVPDETQP